MKKRTPRLFETLFALGFISIFVSLFLAWLLVSNSLTNYFINVAVERNLEISNSITAYIDDKLREALSQLNLIRESIEFNKSSGSEINDLILQMNQINQSFVGIEVVSFEGKVVYTLPQHSSEIGSDRSREAYFREFEREMDVYWSSVQISPYTNSNAITIVVHSRDGFLVGNLDLKEIQELSNVYLEIFGEHKEITITDRNGIYLVNKDISLVVERRLDPHHSMAVDIINGDEVFLHKESGLETVLITSTQIPSTGWIASISEPYYNAIGGINYIIGILISFVTIMLLVYTLLLWRGNSKVIQDLRNFSKRLVNVSQGIETNSGKGNFKEFESLNESFNVMVDKIADRDKKLSNLAYHDALTGFHNRAYLEELILSLMKSPEKEYAVIYLDLDNFSHINDTYGHQVGDQLLIEFSKQLELLLDESIDIVRLGGDEFILIIRAIADFEKAILDLVSKIMSISSSPLKCNDRLIYFTMSTGISFYPNDGNEFWTILRNADTAMYQAKAVGKNTSSYFTQDMNAYIERRLLMEQHLRPAIKNGEFKLEFQPQFSIDGNIIRGFEALVRWDNPTLGRVSPVDFIAITEENKMIIPLGRWIMKQACESIKILNDRYDMQFVMAINVSPLELKEATFADSVIEIINETNIQPHWLEIEITENMSIDKYLSLKITLEKLHQYGVSISIDDFGTGYSSLAYLQNIPLDILKIDRTFITHLGEANDQNLMTETIFLMAKKLGLMTIAEGVETAQHINFLKDLECDFVQGFLMSKPLRMDNLIIFIDEYFNNKKLKIDDV
ncbi:MAG: diguanylate [Erysipelotrichaceae bacterium]|nr:MAG: diguanylate [Erysipelotrichaceae bacterium]